MTIEEYIILRNSGDEVEQIQEKFKLSYDMLWTLELSYQCYLRELPLEQALLLIQNPKIVIINGKPFNSFKQACKYFGFDSAYLYKREKATGIPKEELLQEKINRGIRQLPVQYEGKTYTSFSELCREYELEPRKVQALIDNRGISREEAFSLSLKHKEGAPINIKQSRGEGDA